LTVLAGAHEGLEEVEAAFGVGGVPVGGDHLLDEEAAGHGATSFARCSASRSNAESHPSYTFSSPGRPSHPSTWNSISVRSPESSRSVTVTTGAVASSSPGEAQVNTSRSGSTTSR